MPTNHRPPVHSSPVAPPKLTPTGLFRCIIARSGNELLLRVATANPQDDDDRGPEGEQGLTSLYVLI